jgi:signal transduction histidine kinase
MQNSSAKAKGKQPSMEGSIAPKFADEMLSVLSSMMSVEGVDDVLQKIARAVAELFQIRTLVIGVLDESERIFRVRATYGYDPERSKKIKKFTYTFERLSKDMDEKYRIATSVYFIRPKPEEFKKNEEAFYADVTKIHEPRTDPSVWHELDYIRFVFNNREGRPIGFLEINDSNSGKIPDSNTIDAMHMFSELAAVAIENATMYQKQVEINRKSIFLTDIVTHDINNFNQAITSYLQLASAECDGKDRMSTYLERASTAAWGISEMIRRAHKLQQIEEEGAQNLGPMELGEVLRESIDEVLRENQGQEVKIDLKFGNHRYFTTGNDLAGEIFTNIIINAIEYDPHDKVVVDISIGEFTVEPRKYWCVSVADNGIGIPDTKKNIVFGRVGGGEEDVAPGSGLGLSIVRAIVEAYHGMVWVEDRAPGDPSKGSVFRVALPMSSPK